MAKSIVTAETVRREQCLISLRGHIDTARKYLRWYSEGISLQAGELMRCADNANIYRYGANSESGMTQSAIETACAIARAADDRGAERDETVTLALQVLAAAEAALDSAQMALHF